MEKANDPQPVRQLMTPRCGLGHSGEEVIVPEDPANSREAANTLGWRPADACARL